MNYLAAIILGLIGIIITPTIQAANKLLLSPWVILQNQLRATLNADSCVDVQRLIGKGPNMEININVCEDNKALALAAFANKKYDFGDKLVTVQVYSSSKIPVYADLPSTPEEVAKLLNIALKGNSFFVNAGVDKEKRVDSAFAQFKPITVQYFSDDFSDWHFNTNKVASTAFAEVLDLNPFADNGVSVFATTVLEK